MRPALAVACLAVGCGGPSAPDPHSDTAPTTEVQRFRQLAAEGGWTVQDGAFTLSSMSGCCEAIVNCLDPDPAAPYATYALPPAPGQPTDDPDLYWMWGQEPPPGLSRDFRLDPSEALVWLGSVPPRADYVSFRTMLSSRLGDGGDRERVLGALGPQLTHARIAAERGVDVQAIWETPLIVVSAGDQAVEEQVRAWLIDAGFDARHVHADRIPGDLARMGLDPAADTFATLVQVVDADDPAELAAWQTGGGATLLRATPGVAPMPAAPFEREVLAQGGTGTGERDAYDAPVDALAAAIDARWAPVAPDPALVTWEPYPTYACIDGLECRGNNAEQLRAEATLSGLDDGAFAVAFGVNHVRTGKVTARSIAVHKTTGVGSVVVLDEALVGSARPYLGDDFPAVDDLYAVVFARDCGPHTTLCHEVPLQCPGPANGERVRVRWVDYLEPSTGVAPVPSELVRDRLTRFQPETP